MQKTFLYTCSALIISALCVSCTSPETAASMWLRVSSADSAMAGFRTIEAEGQTRHIVPITEWTADPAVDTYHQLHHHGVAIESDLMAYRIYFDKKQTVDVYAKKTPRLELATSYWYPNDEQLAQHYGDDVLRVSGTVGVGSVKPWHNGKMTHIEPVATRSQRIVEVSRDKAAMEVSVTGWKTEGKTIDMTVRYTIFAHHRDMLCEVFLSAPLDSLCTGVQLIPNKGRADIPVLTADQTIYSDDREYIDLTQGVLLGAWGTDRPVNDTVKYAKETVGLGVYIPAEYAAEVVVNQQDSTLSITHDRRNNLARFAHKTYLRFYLTTVALKEDNPPATNATAFFDYLTRWREQQTD